MRHLVFVILKQVENLKLQIIYCGIRKMKFLTYREIIIHDKILAQILFECLF